MIEINLLNQKGIHKKDSVNFHDIDNDMMSDISSNLDTDFESSHKTVKATVKGKKKNLFIYCFLIILIIAGAIYYQFFVNSKIFIDSQKFQTLIEHIVDNDDLYLNELEYNDYKMQLKIQINSTFYDQNTRKELKSCLDNLTDSDHYELKLHQEEGVDFLTINYLPFLEIEGAGSESLNENDIKDTKRIVGDSLKNVVGNILNSSSSVSNFKIKRFKNDDNIYENEYIITFSE